MSFQIYLSYVKSLNFTETPNYKHLKKIFLDELEMMGSKYDKNFDWIQRDRPSSENNILEGKINKKENDHLKDLLGNNNYYQNNKEQDFDRKSVNLVASITSSSKNKPSMSLKKPVGVKLILKNKNGNLNGKKKKTTTIIEPNRMYTSLYNTKRRSTSGKIKLLNKNTKKLNINHFCEHSLNFTMNTSKYLNHTQ